MGLRQRVPIVLPYLLSQCSRIATDARRIQRDESDAVGCEASPRWLVCAGGQASCSGVADVRCRRDRLRLVGAEFSPSAPILSYRYAALAGARSCAALFASIVSVFG